MRRILSLHAVPVKPTRRTPTPPHPFGLGVDPVLDDRTNGPFRFIITEHEAPNVRYPAAITGRYRMATYVDGREVAEHFYDGCYFRTHFRVIADTMVTEHAEFHRQYEIERFERWMAEQDRIAAMELPAICGGSPERPEATEADRR